MTTDYSALPGFTDVYLEDSFVLSITEQSHQLSFELEAVLRPDHPRYRPPLTGEQFCYANALLTFDNVIEVEWLARSTNRYTDAAGDEDLGNIDSLSVDDQGRYLVEGDWGRVRVTSPRPPQLVFTS